MPLRVAALTQIVHQTVPVGVIGFGEQPPSINAMRIGPIGRGTRDQVPGQRAGRSRLIEVAVRPHDHTPERAHVAGRVLPLTGQMGVRVRQLRP